MRLLSKSWSIRPMSYKQFSNLVEGKNDMYDQLVKINGSVDPLRKTLLIIDEAHKLYGGADLSSVERPNMDKLHAALMNSYVRSGKDSVKLMLMTGTPMTNDPMELIKLLNLMRLPNEQLPVDYDEFAQKYLTPTGEFSRKGKMRFLDEIAGHISYLNRERDARTFAQPKIVPVVVPMSTGNGAEGDDQWALEDLRTALEHADDTLKSADEALKTKKKEVAAEKKAKKAECVGIKAKAEKAECVARVESEVKVIELKGEEAMKQIAAQKAVAKEQKATAKKNITAAKKAMKADDSQLGVIQSKCRVSQRKAKGLSNAV